MQAERRGKFVSTFGPFKLGLYIRDLGTADVIAALRRWRRDIREIPVDLGLPLYDGVFFEERRYLDDAILQLEEVLKAHGVFVAEEEPPKDPGSSAVAKAQKNVQAIISLERARDEELRNASPEHQDYIKRAYGKLIDAMKDQ